MHQQRLRKHGTVAAKRGWRNAPWIDSLYERIDTSGGPDACHPWTGRRASGGYALIQGRCRGSRMRVSRVLVDIDQQVEIPDDLMVLHSCDNPPCCNIRHLRVGTHGENAAEMVTRGRKTRKFSDEVLTEVSRSIGSSYAIAERYGMSQSYVRLIRQQYVPGMHRSFTS